MYLITIKMYITIDEGKKCSYFRTIFRHMKTKIGDVNFRFTQEEFKIQAMDGNQIGLVELVLNRDWFAEYSVSQPVTLGLNCELFDKVLYCANDKHSLSLHFTDDGDTLEVHLDSDEKEIINMHFTINLLDLQCDMLMIPEVEYDADITIRSKIFEKTIKQMIGFAKTLNIQCSEDAVTLETTKDSSLGNGSAKANINLDDMQEYMIEEDGHINLNFNLDYLNWMVQFASLAEHASLHFSPQYPMKLRYDLDVTSDNPVADEEVGDDEQENYIEFYLAPQITDFQ